MNRTNIVLYVLQKLDVETATNAQRNGPASTAPVSIRAKPVIRARPDRSAKSRTTKQFASNVSISEG